MRPIDLGEDLVLFREMQACFNGAASSQLERLLEDRMRRAEKNAWRMSLGIWMSLLAIGLGALLVLAKMVESA